jgi:hypothetical protein
MAASDHLGLKTDRSARSEGDLCVRESDGEDGDPPTQ